VYTPKSECSFVAANTAYVWWQSTGGAASGTLNPTAPAQTGQYEFRYLANGFTSVITSSPVTVTAGGTGYTLTPSPISVAAGGSLSVSWTAPSGSSATDWIGLYAVGAANTAYVWWHYTGGAASGTFNLTAPAQPGQYQFRYLPNGFSDAVRSSIVTVQ
jgi:hypothetical protein